MTGVMASDSMGVASFPGCIQPFQPPPIFFPELHYCCVFAGCRTDVILGLSQVAQFVFITVTKMMMMMMMVLLLMKTDNVVTISFAL